MLTIPLQTALISFELLWLCFSGSPDMTSSAFSSFYEFFRVSISGNIGNHPGLSWAVNWPSSQMAIVPQVSLNLHQIYQFSIIIMLSNSSEKLGPSRKFVISPSAISITLIVTIYNSQQLWQQKIILCLEKHALFFRTWVWLTNGH